MLRGIIESSPLQQIQIIQRTPRKRDEHKTSIKSIKKIINLKDTLENYKFQPWDWVVLGEVNRPWLRFSGWNVGGELGEDVTKNLEAERWDYWVLDCESRCMLAFQRTVSKGSANPFRHSCWVLEPWSVIWSFGKKTKRFGKTLNYKSSTLHRSRWVPISHLQAEEIKFKRWRITGATVT